MRPIIFLDIDDVIAVNPEYSGAAIANWFSSNLHSDETDFWKKVFLPEAQNNLFLLHTAFYPQYGVSSSWCNYLTLKQIKIVFRRTVFDFVEENLHKNWRTPRLMQSGRLSEIQSWISNFLKVSQPVLILDDVESGWNLVDSTFDKKGQVVSCEPMIGFVEPKLRTAIDILQTQIQVDSMWSTK